MSSEIPHSKDGAMEVEITLTQLDAPSASDVRTLIINSDNRTVDVGRASRNPARVFQPSPDNAAFRCPIMSRQHAQLSGSPVHKDLYVEDLGSTHGTFINDKKIVPKTKNTLKSGSILTLGTTVANGPAVYSGKKLRVDFKWSPRYTKETKMISSRIFKVPDSDPEDEQPAVISREPSIEILESHLRTKTYSVPSESEAEESEECEEVVSALRTPPSKVKESPVTSPEDLDVESDAHIVIENESKNKVPMLGLKSFLFKRAGEGSSQYNPIDIDMRKTIDESHIDIESEEEGPDVLPIQSFSKKSSTKPADTPDILDVTDQPRLASPSPSREQMERIIRGTQDRVTKDSSRAIRLVDMVTTNWPEDNQAGASEEEENIVLEESDNDIDVEDEEQKDEEETSIETEASEDDEDGEEDDDFWSRKAVIEEDEEDQDLDEDFPIDFDEADSFEEAAFGQKGGDDLTKPDAELPISKLNTLAKAQAHLLQTRIQEDAHYRLTRVQALSVARTPSPSDAALAKDSTGSRSKSSDIPKHTTSARILHLPNFEWDTPDCWAHRRMDYVSSPSPKKSNYTTGPFAINPTADAPLSADTATAKKPSMSIAFALNELKEKDKVMTAPEAQPSKLHISNLVNSQHAEPIRSTKRKAAEISQDAEDLDFDTAYYSFPIPSQDTQLPDAQPREHPILTETSISLGETPGALSTMTTIATETSQAVEEPARKKVKTSSSTGRGIGKFLLGVGVGAVGFAAAFLATIPASVMEEARLGL